MPELVRLADQGLGVRTRSGIVRSAAPAILAFLDWCDGHLISEQGASGKVRALPFAVSAAASPPQPRGARPVEELKEGTRRVNAGSPMEPAPDWTREGRGRERNGGRGVRPHSAPPTS